MGWLNAEKTRHSKNKYNTVYRRRIRYTVCLSVVYVTTMVCVNRVFGDIRASLSLPFLCINISWTHLMSSCATVTFTLRTIQGIEGKEVFLLLEFGSVLFL